MPDYSISTNKTINMKSVKLLMLAAFAMLSVSVIAQEKTDSFKVYGNCGMCKKRIEKTAKGDGVSAASWDTETKMLTITYDAAKVSNDSIQKKIAAVGHDTEKFEADDKVYEKLPGCCLYERKKKETGKKTDTPKN
jgi:copper chaperone CopZ